MANRQRWVLLGLAALVAVVALIVVGTGGGDDAGVIDTRTQPAAGTSTSAPAGASAASDPTIVLRGGRPDGGVRDLRFRNGGHIVFVVRSDADAEIHLHGYDIAKDVKAGGTVRYDVPAEIDGRFDVEVEGTGTKIAEVEVVP